LILRIADSEPPPLVAISARSAAVQGGTGASSQTPEGSLYRSHFDGVLSNRISLSLAGQIADFIDFLSRRNRQYPLHGRPGSVSKIGANFDLPSSASREQSPTELRL
jgi:hypothetical protein